MSRYGAVPLSDPASSAGERELHLCIPKGLASFLEGGKDAATLGSQREKPTDQRDVVESRKLEFAINAESIRFIAYLFFWSMCFFAIAMTKTFVAPRLLAGPGPDEPTCPPFQISKYKNGTINDKSGGFDIATDSHLQDAFGFGNVSNICL
jgi:hypothetical protein